MSQFVALYTDSITAADDIVAATFVGANLKTAADGAGVIGVARSDGAVGELVPVDMLGSAVVKAGAAIPPYTDIEVGPNGSAVPHAAGVAVGRTLRTGATAAGQAIEVFLLPGRLA